MGTFDGSSVKLYVDGILRASTAFTGEIIPKSDANLWLGNYNYGIPTQNYFMGKLDDVLISNQSLSETEIIPLMNTNLSQIPELSTYFLVLISLGIIIIFRAEF